MRCAQDHPIVLWLDLADVGPILKNGRDVLLSFLDFVSSCVEAAGDDLAEVLLREGTGIEHSEIEVDLPDYWIESLSGHLLCAFQIGHILVMHPHAIYQIELLSETHWGCQNQLEQEFAQIESMEPLCVLLVEVRIAQF